MLSWPIVLMCMPSVSELIYFNLYSDHFQIQISSPNISLEPLLDRQGLLVYSHGYRPQTSNAVYSQLNSLSPCKPAALVVLSVSLT